MLQGKQYIHFIKSMEQSSVLPYTVKQLVSTHFTYGIKTLVKCYKEKILSEVYMKKINEKKCEDFYL